MLLVMPVRMTNRLLFNFFIDDNALFVVGRGKISAAFKLDLSSYLLKQLMINCQATFCTPFKVCQNWTRFIRNVKL
jgi:hypothetical protein